MRCRSELPGVYRRRGVPARLERAAREQRALHGFQPIASCEFGVLEDGRVVCDQENLPCVPEPNALDVMHDAEARGETKRLL